MNYKQYIEDNTIRCEANYRGGGIEVDLSGLFPNLDEPAISAYQNYLGGGILGSVCSDCNFDTEALTDKQQAIVFDFADQLKQYFHNLTNHVDDKWESQTYSKNQSMPESAY